MLIAIIVTLAVLLLFDVLLCICATAISSECSRMEEAEQDRRRL